MFLNLVLIESVLSVPLDPVLIAFTEIKVDCVVSP